jgi:hypothetical protein
LNSLRDDFIHFNTKSWSIEQVLIEAHARGSIEVAQFILVESEAVLWYENSLQQRAHAAIERLSEQLGTKA